MRVGGTAADAFVKALVAVALGLGRGEARAQLRELLLQAELAGFLHRQELGELRDLRGEPAERGVFAGHFLGQIELHHHEHGEQEDDAEDQRRQGIDEARPVVHAAFAAADPCKRHQSRLNGSRARVPSLRAAS